MDFTVFLTIVERLQVPKLKPNAPEFVPQRLRTPTNAADDTHRVNPKLEKKTKVKNKMERKERKVMDDRKDETSIKQCANPGSQYNIFNTRSWDETDPISHR